MDRKTDDPGPDATDGPAGNNRTGRREEKTQRTRQRLFDSAIRLVGDVGYAGATIRKITAHARIAHGTFYNYFDSQQDIFDQLLPYLGDKLLAYLDERLDQETAFIDRQDIVLVGFHDFTNESPAFYRVMAEAEVYAPQAYRVYVANVAAWFIRHFASDPRRGDMGVLDSQQLELLALMVMAANHYLSMRFGEWMGDVTRIPNWAVETFRNFVRGGIESADSGLAKRRLAEDEPAQTRRRDEAGAQARQVVVKFTGRHPVGGADLRYSAHALQLDCRQSYLNPGHAIVELDIDRRTLNSRGAVAGGTLSALVEVAAGASMACNRAEQLYGETISLNCTLIRQATEGVLFAEAKMENAGRNVRFVSVRVTLDSLEGPTIATGTATMRVIE